MKKIVNIDAGSGGDWIRNPTVNPARPFQILLISDAAGWSKRLARTFADREDARLYGRASAHYPRAGKRKHPTWLRTPNLSKTFTTLADARDFLAARGWKPMTAHRNLYGVMEEFWGKDARSFYSFDNCLKGYATICHGLRHDSEAPFPKSTRFIPTGCR